MITLKFKDIMQAKDPIVRLAQANLPVATAHRVSKLLRAFKDELDFIQGERDKIFKEFGVTEGPTGMPQYAKPEDSVLVDARWNELMEQSVDLNCEKVNLVPVLGDNSLRMNAFDIEVLEPFAIFESAPAPAPVPVAAE